MRSVVVPAKDMTDEQFAMHWNKRHNHLDTPGQKVPFGEGATDNYEKVMACYRAFHDTAHRLEVGEKYDHIHQP